MGTYLSLAYLKGKDPKNCKKKHNITSLLWDTRSSFWIKYFVRNKQ